ncbi:hypothetical protein [Lysinibacillus composti]|nr:hypothetical protein [Lysinibacillus composti]
MSSITIGWLLFNNILHVLLLLVDADIVGVTNVITFSFGVSKSLRYQSKV